MKYSLIIILIAGNILVNYRTSFAQDTLLNKYLQIAANNNPAVQSKFKDYYAALERIPQVGALPDPAAALGYYILPVQTRVGSGIANIQLSQSFPWFGTLAAKKDEASKWAAAKYQAFKNTSNDLFYQLKLMYYQLYFIDKSIRSRMDYLKILQRDEKVTLAKVSGGKTSFADVLRVQMSTKENETQLIILQDKWISLSADFNQLLNRPVHDSIQVTDSLYSATNQPDEEALLDSIFRKNPLLNQLREQDTAYQSSELVARKSGLPNLGVGLNYSVIARTNMTVPKNGQDIFMPMVSLSIPLNRSKYKAKEREARLMRESNLLQIQSAENSLSATLVSALNQYKDAGNNIELYTQLLAQANQTNNILTTAYSGGSEAYVEVLRIEEKVLDYTLSLHKAITDQNSAVALLNKLIAKELQ